jgi:aspartate carbamoyltransferase catalytic subunit
VSGAANVFSRKDLLQIRGLSRGEIESILEASRRYQDPSVRTGALNGHVVVNLFLEPSTRTRTSFEIAAKRLGADVVNIAAAASSLVKGETLVDTTRTLDAMRPSAIVVRHASAGAPAVVANNTRASVVNGGDGAHEHPTQALLDARTILDRKGRLDGLKVVIAGDVRHSRVARSNAHLLTAFGARVVFTGPGTLLPDGIDALAGEGAAVEVARSFDEAVEGADVVMMLRVQLERQQEAFFPSLKEYHARYGLTAERLARAARDAVVMHPGPVNRGVEIAPEVADGPHSAILQQVANGVAVRMAVLEAVITHGGA